MKISQRLGKAIPKLLLIFLTLSLVVSTLGSVAKADRGGFSPRRVKVTETEQRAIIAWNGTHEELVLSTDVTSVNESEVVEIMPLPSNPMIGSGETRSFEIVTALVNSFFDVTVNSQPRYRYRYGWGLYLQGGGYGTGGTLSISITFQETIGFHFLTVVKAENAAELTRWLGSFLENHGYDSQLPVGLENLTATYIQDEMKYFVVDMITTNSTTQTVNPLIYQFQTSKLFYPLRISSLFSGDTSISLFTITKNEIKKDSVFGSQFGISAQFRIKKEASTSVCANFTGLFSTDPYMYYLTYVGAQKNFSEDLNAEIQPTSDTSTFVAAYVGVAFGLTLLLFFFAPKIEDALDVRLPVKRRFQMASLLTGLAGLSLIWVGFFFPWGLRTFGDVLVLVDGTWATSQSSMNILYFLLLLGAVLCYVYLLLIGGDSKIAATHFTVTGGSVMMISVAIAAASMRTLSSGIYLTVAGSAFIGLAGFISLRRLRLEPAPRHKMMSFRTYVIRRFLGFLLTLFAVFVVIFYLLSLLPAGMRIGLY